jgi:hypothetical protein
MSYIKPNLLVHYFTTRYTRPSKGNFHYNKQQWTTQQLASAPILCTATRTREETSTTRRQNGTRINGPMNQQQEEGGGAEAGGGESGAASTANNKQQQLQTRCNGARSTAAPSVNAPQWRSHSNLPSPVYYIVHA